MIITAPGRVCLFGDHQDYLGLPVIACAINKEVTLFAEENNSDTLQILMPDIDKHRTISIQEEFSSLKKEDYFASALRVVRRYGCIPNKGYTLTIKSTIPMNAGLSSSSAVIVAWVHFLLKAFPCEEKVTPQLIAQLAYEAEVVEYQSPGGRMDQYTSAIGGILYIDTCKENAFEVLNTSEIGLVVGESGIGKDTTGVLRNIRNEAEEAIHQIIEKVPEFNLKAVRKSEIEKYKAYISEESYPYFEAAIYNHDITQKAYKVLTQTPVDVINLGDLMYEHHCVLRDSLSITVPLIDQMIEAAIRAGAYGAKMVGSGMGGCIVAIASKENKTKVITAIKETGAINAYGVSINTGTTYNS